MNDTQRRRILTFISLVTAFPGGLLFGCVVGVGLANAQGSIAFASISVILLRWLTLISVTLMAVATWYSPTNYFYRRGRYSFKHRDFEKAIDQFTLSHLARKKWILPLTSRALCLAELGDFEGAMADLDEAIGWKTESHKLYTLRAGLYFRMDDFENALLDADTAVRLNPKSAFALNIRGIAYLNLGEYEAGLRDIEGAIRQKPKQAVIFSNRGMAYLRTGDMGAALADFENAILLNPKLPHTYLNRGEYHLLQQNYTAALDDFQTVNSLYPDLDHAIAGLALTHFLMGNTAPAQNLWNSLIERDERYVDEEWAIRHLQLHPDIQAAVRQIGIWE